MRDLVAGFGKQAMSADGVGALAGTALGMAFVRGGPVARLVGGLIGGETGYLLGKGIRGMAEVPSHEDLTPEEQSVVREEAEAMAADRNKQRLGAAALGVAYGLASGTPWGFLPALPAATIGVYGAEKDRQRTLANDLRRARKKGKAS